MSEQEIMTAWIVMTATGIATILKIIGTAVKREKSQ